MKIVFVIGVVFGLLGLAACNGENPSQTDGAADPNQNVTPQSSVPNTTAPAIGSAESTQAPAPVTTQ